MWPILALCGMLLSGLEAVQAQSAVLGRVVDENGAAVEGAKVQFTTPGGQQAATAFSDSTGNFNLTLAPGEYVIRAEHAGFFVLENHPAEIQSQTTHLTLTLNHLREVVQSIEVSASPPGVDPAQTVERKELNSVEILQVPYPAPNDLRSSLPLFQGVIQDNNRQLHFQGGNPDQAGYLLDGFNVADPVTGTLETRLSIDAVRSLDLETSRYAADKGRGSTASLDIRSGMGDDKLSLSGTNFFPGFSSQHGIYLHKWTPRVTFSGPIKRGRAWFFNGFDAIYTVDTIPELPKGQDRSRDASANNLTRFQVNVTPAQILTGSFLLNYADANRAGLSFLNPVETTTHNRRNMYMSTLRYQIYLASGSLLEFGFADSRGLVDSVPAGNQVYQITPVGNRGNYFVDLRRNFQRQEITGQILLPSWNFKGTHQFSAGLDVQRAAFDQTVSRHPYEVLRTDGSVARYVLFTGSGAMGTSNVESAMYVQDRWSPLARLQLEIGLRFDRDQMLRSVAPSPRASLAWAPEWLHGAKFSAGIGVFYDPLTLGVLAQNQEQSSIATFYRKDGSVALGPVITSFRADIPSLQIPGSTLFNMALERKLPFDFYGKAGFTHRAGHNGFVFVPEPQAPNASEVTYSLLNRRNDRYNAFEVSLRRTFAGKYEWFGGYTRSSARTNAVVQYSLENPIFAQQAPGHLDWDTPNRFLTWGWAPFPSRLLPPVLSQLLSETNIEYLAEARTGFPFSVVSEEGFMVGPPNRLRFPNYFNLNLHLEKKLRLRNTLWAFRFGYNNLTNSLDPNVVNNVLESPRFMTFGRGQARAFTVRLRFLGRKI